MVLGPFHQLPRGFLDVMDQTLWRHKPRLQCHSTSEGYLVLALLAVTCHPIGFELICRSIITSVTLLELNLNRLCRYDGTVHPGRSVPQRPARGDIVHGHADRGRIVIEMLHGVV